MQAFCPYLPRSGNTLKKGGEHCKLSSRVVSFGRVKSHSGLEKADELVIVRKVQRNPDFFFLSVMYLHLYNKNRKVNILKQLIYGHCLESVRFLLQF